MINKRVIQKFLARPLDSYTWLKKSSNKELDAALAELEPKPDFGSIKFWAHQKVAFLILHELKRFMLFIEMGGGKTLITLSLIRYRKQCGEKPRAIVFVPYITSVETWVEEVAKHAPDLNCVPLLGSGSENLANLSGAGDLFVICYQSAVAMVTETVRDKKGKSKWQLKASEVRAYFSSFDMLVCDEIHRAKGASSLTYRMLRAISAQCDWVLGLTGTPFGRDLSDLWPQFYLIDFGETLGPTKGFFMEVFYNHKRGFFGGREFTFKKKLMPDLKRMIRNRSIRYNINEFADMPPQEYIIKTVPAPPDAQGYCKLAIQAINDAAKAKGKGHYSEIEQNYLKLRQLSSGFMTLRGEDSTKLQVQFDQNPKLDLLMELIDAMPLGTKGVIFHHFIYSNHVISSRLKEAKIGHARIWSGQKDPIGELRRFKADPKCRLLVINWKSGSSSLNLQNANYMFNYEQPDSAIDRSQGEARVWRPGQQLHTFIYDIIVRGTVDMRMYKANQAGASLLKELLGGAKL